MKINGKDLLSFKKEKSKKTLLKIIIIFVLIILIFFMLELFLFFKMKSDYNLNNKIINDGLRYEKSIYIKYENKIYASIFGVAYQLEDVDIASFKVIDTMDYSENYIGVDKNNVYFGNQIVPDLKPDKLYIVGNGYYSDGVNSYFCSNSFEKNEDLVTKSKIRQYIGYYFFKENKPQEYAYPFKKVETNKILKKVDNLPLFATDEKNIYFKGEILENADLNTLKKVVGKNDMEYFFDKNNVYYQSKLLPLPCNNRLKTVSVEQRNRNYLFDEVNGNIFLKDYAFDKKYTPYEILGENSNHINDLLFVSKNGIFFYNFETKVQERIGDNIFIGKIEKILPSIISDDKNIYYLYSYDVYKKKKVRFGYIDVLVSKNIGIFYLDEKKDWEKVKDIDYGTIGEIWKKGNKYYYFDNLGYHQLINNVVYEISDKRTLDYLSNKNNINSDEIREFVNTKKLVAVDGKEVITASVKYKESHTVKMIFIILGIVIVIIIILIIYFKWKKMKLEMKEIDEKLKKQSKKIEALTQSYNDNKNNIM